MAIKKTSKEEIIQESIKLFKIQGYYNTSMANIADSCGLIKGSIYHYFKSKDEIGLESLKYIHEYFEKNIFIVAYDKNISAKERIKSFVKKIDKYFLNSQGGCLLGNLALEVSNNNLNFKDIIKEYFNAWEEALYNIFIDKYSKNKALELAKQYVALSQGAIMMMNLYENKEDYLKVGKKLIEIV